MCFAGGNIFSVIPGGVGGEVSGGLLVLLVRFKRGSYFSALPDGGAEGCISCVSSFGEGENIFSALLGGVGILEES